MHKTSIEGVLVRDWKNQLKMFLFVGQFSLIFFCVEAINPSKPINRVPFLGPASTNRCVCEMKNNFSVLAWMANGYTSLCGSDTRTDGTLGKKSKQAAVCEIESDEEKNGIDSLSRLSSLFFAAFAMPTHG